MCLITKQKKPIKIKKDMTVYKKVNYINDKFTSEHNSFNWELNHLYSTELKPSKNIKMHDEFVYEKYKLDEIEYNYNEADKQSILNSKGLISIGSGFHSVNNINRFIYGLYGKNVYVKCIIPKGSLIYKDKTGLIVSNQIIMKEIVK
jgi:hypothetical protein